MEILSRMEPFARPAYLSFYNKIRAIFTPRTIPCERMYRLRIIRVRSGSIFNISPFSYTRRYFIYENDLVDLFGQPPWHGDKAVSLMFLVCVPGQFRVLNSSAYVIVGPVSRYICKSAENRSQFMARQGCHYLKNKVITKVSVGIFVSPFPQRNDFSVLQVLYTEPFSVMFGETYELLMAEGLVTFQSFK